MTTQPPSPRLRYYFGETLEFPTAHLMLDAFLPRPPAGWNAWRKRSSATARQVAKRLGNGEILLRAADLFDRTDNRSHPWLLWTSAFQQSRGVPDWHCRFEMADSGDVRLRLACPYVEAVKTWARIGLKILHLADLVSEGRTVRISRPEWELLLDGKSAVLPPAEVMAFHASLAARGLDWSWRGGRRTAVGWGVRQRTIDGGSDDPVGLAGTLAQEDPRIPIYTVTGSVGKTTTARLLTQLLESAGLRVGATASDGCWAAGRRIGEGDCIGGRDARDLLRRHDIDAAVIEVGRGGIVGQGIPYRTSDIAILLNVEAVHLGVDGVETVEEMADLKGLTLTRARLAILNREDGECRRLGAFRDPLGCIWFSTSAGAEELGALSSGTAGALGVRRNGRGEPAFLEIWRDGHAVRVLPLDGVAPYHGLLGEKTVEELLAAVGAAWFGPVRVDDLESVVRRLHLDNVNHCFRTSTHLRGDILFVLDKAGEEASLKLLMPAIEALAYRESIGRRICVFTRSASELPEFHRRSCAALHANFDEFVCFDRPDTYTRVSALPCYEPGSIPLLLKEELSRLNAAEGRLKPIHLAQDWDGVENCLRGILPQDGLKTMILVNQPATSCEDLNDRILAFVSDQRPLKENVQAAESA